MIGIPLSGPLLIYGDNMSVIHNTQILDSTLRNNSNLMCYHAIQESVVMGKSPIASVPTGESPSEFLTKFLIWVKAETYCG